MILPKYSKGFTLLEILISVSILAILSAGIIPSFSNYIKNQTLKQAQEQVKSDLRSIQNRALTGSFSDHKFSGVPTAYWGVRFTNNSETYTNFISTINTSCPPGTSVRLDQGNSTLPGGIKYFGNNGCIFFSLKNGDISTFPSTFVSPLNLKYESSGIAKTVLFNSAGLIYTNN